VSVCVVCDVQQKRPTSIFGKKRRKTEEKRKKDSPASATRWRSYFERL
jgi:hypothetical protein